MAFPINFEIVGHVWNSYANSLPGGQPDVPLLWEDVPNIPADVWTTVQVEGGYQIKSVDSERMIGMRYRELFCTYENGHKWSIEPAGGGSFKIKVPNEDLVWTMVVPGKVILKPADGSQEQLFRLNPFEGQV